MIELNLRRTRYEISEHLNSNNSNPLRIVELINRMPPCNWTFKFTFDSTGRTDVWIDFDSDVSDGDILGLFDGSLEEIFFSDAISLYQAGKYFIGDTSNILKDPLHSNLITLQNSEENTEFPLVLRGFWQSDSTPPEIQKKSSILSYVLENTWLGSPDFADCQYCIRWIVFGTEVLIHPGNRYEAKLVSKDSFTTQTNLCGENRDYIGQASFHTSPSLKDNEIYTTFGPLVPKPKNWLTRKREDFRWIVEISSQKLNQAIFKGNSTTNIINELLNCVEVTLASVTTLDCFLTYKQNVQRKKQTKAASNLKERQKRAQTENRIIFNGKPVMVVPSNENEVLVLLCKLEAFYALPFHEFILWEYTARAGIDAIASYQIEEVDVPVQFAAVELEYYFENFFEHDHPHHQVNLVICWDFRNDEPSVELHQRSEWLFEYRNDYSFTVVVLSRIPDLQVERS